MYHSEIGASGQDAQQVVRHALEVHHPAIALACSFSIEDAVLIDMMIHVRSDARVFAIDTGRLNGETHECAEKLRRKYGLRIEWVFPRSEAVEALLREKGSYSFKDSVENRRECCHVRKVEPLSRALAGLTAWITGMRREQSVTRASLDPIERDAAHGGILKYNPLAAWTTQQVWDYVRAHSIPYNRLYDAGYASIGCEPCTRPIGPGEDLRAGRWWWEHPEHRECGLHLAAKVMPGGEGI